MPSEWLSPQIYQILTHGVTQDLPFYTQLSLSHKGPILDIGAGLGRLSTPLLEAGQPVVMLEHNPLMCAELCRKLSTLSNDVQQRSWVLEQDITTVDGISADALKFGVANKLPAQFSLVILGLRTIHLFNQSDLQHILYCAKQLLAPNGVLTFHYSNLPQAAPQPSWTLVAEYPLKDGTIEVEECFFYHAPSQQYHLRHRIWQSNLQGQHVGSWRVAHDLYAIDVQEITSQLYTIGFKDVQTTSLHGTESFIVAKV